MALTFTQIDQEYWRIEAGQVKLGQIVRKGTTGFFKGGAPYQYEYRSTFTVVGEGRRVFGALCDTFDEAKEKAIEHMDRLAEMIKE